MADTNWLRKAPPAPDSNDDPFAELTRIMGFDPRVPFRGSQQAASQPASEAAAPQHVAAPNVDLSDDDLDLSIDLERELIGALEPEMPEPAHAHEAQQAPLTVTQFQQPARVMDTGDEPSLDEQAYGGAWSSPRAAASDYSAAPDHAADEAEFAEYVADEPAPGASQAAYSQAYRAEETDYARADSADASADYEPYVAEPQAQEVYAHTGQAYAEAGDAGAVDADHERDLAAHLDEELVASFESDLADDDDDWLNEGHTAYAEHDREEAPEQAYAAPQQERSSQSDEFARDFDTAMAEVDMDFTAAPAAVGAEQAMDDPARYAEQAEIEDDLEFEDDLGSVLADDLDAEAELQEEPDTAYAPDPSYASDRGEFAAVSEEEQAETGDVEPAYAPQAFEAAGFDDRSDFDAAAEFDATSQFDAEPGVEEAQEQPTEDPAQTEIDDAIAELAAMVRGYDSPRPSAVAPQNAIEAEAPSAASADMPDIETVDVPEDAVALADDLDIPDVDYSQDAAPQFDDLDAELAAAFGEPAIETMQPAPVEARTASQDFDLNGGYDAAAGRNASFQAAPYAVAAGAGAAAVHYAQGNAREEDFQVHRHPAAQDDDYDFDFDTDPDDELATASAPAIQPRPSMRRGLTIASIVGGIAVIGAIGAFAFSGGDGIASGEPALVKADADPIKVKPENPGGTTLPNQESQVFDRAAGAAPAAPGQQQLISNEEEPVDMAARFPDALPEPIDESAEADEPADTLSPADASAKGEDRIEQAIAAAENQPEGEETIAVAPRKVRTMVVKSDGTLVPREEVAPEPETVGSTTAADSLTDPSISAPQAAGPTAELPGAGAPKAAAEAPAVEQAPAASAPAQETAAAAAQESEPAPAQETAAAPAAEAPRASPSRMPDSVPVAPSRPADQPLDIVGEVKADQVAALAPAKAAAAAGSWSMQIASQPSEAAAQASYRDLSRRYSGVLGDRTANIVKAEIAGKGTFWRVRVPAGSRNEAIKLCESYKAAGGNCFVSR
jgi:hypothetical protein